MPDTVPIPEPFRPDPATLARLLVDLADSDLTLRQIARDYHTDLFQLNTFLASAPALAEAHYAAALRIRLAAASQLPEVIPALLTMIRSYEFETNRLRPRTPELELRLADHARDSRRAMHLLYRIANYNPRPLRIRATDITTPNPHPSNQPVAPRATDIPSPPPSPTSPAPRDVGATSPTPATPPTPSSTIPPTPDQPATPSTPALDRTDPTPHTSPSRAAPPNPSG